VSSELLRIRDLRVRYDAGAAAVEAVSGVSFELRRGERLGLVGESGCGKTSLLNAILRILDGSGRVAAGEIVFDGIDLAKLTEEEMRRKRLAEIAFMPQGAMNALNPVMRVGNQVALAIQAHEGPCRRSSLRQRVAGLLRQVHLDGDIAGLYPHELSGGMRQRVCMAMAISLGPRLIMADEPTSALDVIVQRAVCETLGEVSERLGAAVLLAGHDMALMAQFVERLGVMYCGRLVETGPVAEVFARPLHPYTRMLIECLPSMSGRGALRGIPGMPPSPCDLPRGCLFSARCPEATDECGRARPEAVEAGAGRTVECFLHGGRANGAAA
jgi:peptide/nickel transport system ATP-binding protein